MTDDRFVDVHGTLRRSGGAAREVEERGVVGSCRCAFSTTGHARHQVSELVGVIEGVTGTDEQHVAERGERLANGRDLPPIERVRRDQHLSLSDLHPLADGLRTERGEQHARDAPVLECAQHRDVELGHASEQHEHAIAADDGEVVEDLHERGRAVGKLAVAEVTDLSSAAQTSDRQLVPTRSTRVAVDALVGDVEPTVGEEIERRPRVLPREPGTRVLVVEQVRSDPVPARRLDDRLVPHELAAWS